MPRCSYAPVAKYLVHAFRLFLLVNFCRLVLRWKQSKSWHFPKHVFTQLFTPSSDMPFTMYPCR